MLESDPPVIAQGRTGLFRSNGASTLAVALTALVTYVMTLGYDFAFDDHYVIPAAWQVGAGSPLDVLRAPVRAGEVLLVYFRPLTALTYWWDGFLWQGNPGGFHLTNILLHAAVSILVLQVARHLLLPGPGALLAGLLFAVHPIHVEAVAWVQGRVDLLSATGVLLALLLGLVGAEALQHYSNFRSYIGPSSDHCISTTPNFYSEAVNGVRFRDWFAGLVNGSAVDNVACTAC